MEFIKVFFKKSFKLVLNYRDKPVMLHISLLLLLLIKNAVFQEFYSKRYLFIV